MSKLYIRSENVNSRPAINIDHGKCDQFQDTHIIVKLHSSLRIISKHDISDKINTRSFFVLAELFLILSRRFQTFK